MLSSRCISWIDPMHFRTESGGARGECANVETALGGREGRIGASLLDKDGRGEVLRTAQTPLNPPAGAPGSSTLARADGNRPPRKCERGAPRSLMGAAHHTATPDTPAMFLRPGTSFGSTG